MRINNGKIKPTRTESIICGGIAGLISRFVVAPLDVVKIRFQLDISTQRPGSAMIRTLYKIAKNEGLTALWKGNIPAEAMYICYGAIQFTTYKQFNKLLDQLEVPKSANSFTSGAAAGVVSTMFTYPMDLLRTRFAAQKDSKNYKSISHALSKIYTQEGLNGFFRGLTPTLMSIVPYMGIFFASYENFKSLIINQEYLKKIAPEASAGFIAGAFSKMIVFPLDVVRKRFQVQGPGRASFSQLPVYSTSVLKCISQIVKFEGIRGLYKGFVISLLKNAPFTAVTMYTFERSLKILRYLENKAY